MTIGEPAFAQAMAHSALIGFLNPLVNAQAESRTYPLTVIGFPPSLVAANAAATNANTSKSFGALRRFICGILPKSGCCVILLHDPYVWASRYDEDVRNLRKVARGRMAQPTGQ